MSKIDDAFSELVRRKSGGLCAVGKLFPEKCESPVNYWQELHCSHTLYSRRFYAIRWDQDNCDAVCNSCHRLLENGFAKEFKLVQIGEIKVNELIEKAVKHHKRWKFEEEEIYLLIRGELNELV